MGALVAARDIGGRSSAGESGRHTPIISCSKHTHTYILRNLCAPTSCLLLCQNTHAHAVAGTPHLQAFTPAITLLLGVCVGLERPDWRLLLAIGLIAGGTAGAVLVESGAPSFKWVRGGAEERGGGGKWGEGERGVGPQTAVVRASESEGGRPRGGWSRGGVVSTEPCQWPRGWRVACLS